MKVRLQVSNNKANIKRILIQDDAIVGRSKDCNLRVASAQVSRQHCRIGVRGDQVIVTDLGSANGTYLGGKLLKADEPTIAQDGQELVIGPAKFVFRIEGAVPPPTADRQTTESADPADALDDILETDSSEDQTAGFDFSDAKNDDDSDEIRIDLSDPESDAVQFEDDEIEVAGEEPAKAEAEPAVDDNSDDDAFAFLMGDDK